MFLHLSVILYTGRGGGRAWQGGHTCREVCVAGGVHGRGVCVAGETPTAADGTVLLECTLVLK